MTYLTQSFTNTFSNLVTLKAVIFLRIYRTQQSNVDLDLFSIEKHLQSTLVSTTRGHTQSEENG